MGVSQDKSADSSDPLRHRVIDDDGTVYADWTWAFKVRARNFVAQDLGRHADTLDVRNSNRLQRSGHSSSAVAKMVSHEPLDER